MIDNFQTSSKSDFVEHPKATRLQEKIQKTTEDARAICALQGADAKAWAAAWDVVEELRAEAAYHQVKQSTQTPLEACCKANPDAVECQVYKD